MNKFDSVSQYYNYLNKLNRTYDKSQLICELCTGKEVLDIGCIDHSITTALELGDNWLHKRIHKVAKRLTGIDVLEKDAALLNEEGWNIIATDAEHFRIDQKFDVINAADIIEHLTNIGEFLESIRLHLNKDGIVIITTPNPFNIEQFMKIMFRNTVGVHDQHTVWIDPKVMWETARRHDFIIADFFWIETRFKVINMPSYLGLFQSVIDYVLNFIMNIRPLFKRDFCVILKDNKELLPDEHSSH